MSEIDPDILKIIEEVTKKTISFDGSLNNLFLTSPLVSFLKCFKKNENNDINSFNLETLPKELLDSCFKEDENVNVRSLYFNNVNDNNRNLQFITMKDVINQLGNFIDDKDLFNYLNNNFENKMMSDMLKIYLKSISDDKNQKEEQRIEKFTKIVTEMNQKVKLELDAKDLYLLSFFIEKQNNIKCKAIFILNFLLESYIRGYDDAFYKLFEYADLLNEKLSSYNTDLEEEWLLKLMAQHVLAIIYSCKIRLLNLNDAKAKALFENVFKLYNNIKEAHEDTICKLPQSIICYLILQNLQSSEYINTNFEKLLRIGDLDKNSWCKYKLYKLQQKFTTLDIDEEKITDILEYKEHVLYLYDSIKNLDNNNFENQIEHNLLNCAKRGYAFAFQKLETIYNQKKNYELSKFCKEKFIQFKQYMNTEKEIKQYNMFTTLTEFDDLMIDFPLNPIIVNAVSLDIEGQVRDSLELLMDQYNEIKLYLIIGPFLNKLNNEWNDLKLKLNKLNMNDNVVKSIINEFNNYTLLKQLLNNEKQGIDSILNYLLQNSNDLNENVKQLLENYFNEKQKEQQVSTSTFINEPIEPNVTSSQLITIDPRYCCKEHGYPLEYICYDCNDVIVCYKCGFKYHSKHNLKEVNEMIEIEANKIKDSKNKLENKTQTFQQSLQQVEQSITKVNNQKEHEATKLDQSANNLINAIQKRRDILKDNLNQKHNERITILENEKTNLTENIQFIQNEVTNININELKNNGIELINKRKELNNFELNKLNNSSSSSLLSNTFLNTCNQFEIVLSFEEQEWINKINKQFGYVVDGIVNPSLCLIEDIPNIFIKDENYKLKLQLKSEKGNLLKGGYLIKSFILNESGDNKIDDCKVIDNNDGTYFIEFKCPSNIELFKLKTLIEDKEMKVHEFKVFNYELNCSSDLVENKLIKLNLKSNFKVNLGQPYLVYNGCNGKEYCNLNNHNDSTFTIEFKCPLNPFKLFTTIEGKEVLLYEFNNIINLINYSEILNYNSQQLLIEKELIKLTLQLKTNNNINYTKNNVNIQSYLTLKENNTKIQDCKVINNNNGTFTIEFQSPSSPFILNTLIEEKKMKLYEFNNVITTELNINGQTIIENQNNKFILKTNRNNFNKIESFITTINSNNKICQYFNSKVFDKNGQFIKQFGKSGSGNGEFYYITALALNSNNGQLYVLENSNYRIQMFK
ncbi:hypothetical protein ABK040_013314 [Willaertia magna]